MSSTLIWAGLILILVLLFKKHIDNTFSNFSTKAKIKIKDIDIDLNGNDPISQSVQLEQTNYKHFGLKKAFQNVMVTNNEKFIRDRLIEAKLSSDVAIDVLINHLAHTQLIVALLVIDKLIYAQQVELLSYINVQTKPLPETNLFPFFKEWQEKSKSSNYNFQQFLNFLLQQNLINQNISGYTIAPLGKEYLSFLIRVGRPIPDEKPYQFHAETTKANE